jgi:hypothetical protein
MTETPSFLRRKTSVHLPATPGYTQQQAQAFLTEYAEDKKELAIARRALEDAAIEREKLEDRLEMRADEIKRLARGRDEYLRQYSELKIQLNTVITTAVNVGESCKRACQNAMNECDLQINAMINDAKAALESVRQAMVAKGIDPIDASLPPPTEEDSKIAAHFGAHNRKTDRD